MKPIRAFLRSSAAFVLACQVTHAAARLKPVALPVADGEIVGSGFSPDSSRVALVRYIRVSASTVRHTIQIVDLKSGDQISQGELPDEESLYVAMSLHFIEYSYDGRYILLATSDSDVLLILDAANLQTVRRIILHPETQHLRSLSAGEHNSHGVVSVSVASNADMFGVLTYNRQLGVNEIFVGSFASGEIIKSWSLGPGYIQSTLGRTSLSLSENGLQTAVSVIPATSGKLPKDFSNVRLYKSDSGELTRAIRTDGLAGQIALMPEDNVLVSRIDTPTLFSKKACIEKWNLAAGVITERLCDKGRHVESALGISLASDLVAGFGCQVHKDLEGNLYSVTGRIDLWDMKSGALIAYLEETSGLRLISAYFQMSPNGSWLMANQSLLQIETTAENR